MDDSDGTTASSSVTPSGRAGRERGRRGPGSPSFLFATAAAGGLLAGAVTGFSGITTDGFLQDTVEKDLLTAVTVLRVSEGANRLATGATHLEAARSGPYRQSLYVGLRQQVQYLHGLSAQLRENGGQPVLQPLQRLGNGLDVTVDDLNARTEQRNQMEADLRAAIGRVPERRGHFHAAMASLRDEALLDVAAGQDGAAAEKLAARDALDELGRTLADLLLLAAGHQQPSGVQESRRAFERTVSRLDAALNLLPIGLNSAARAEGARQLIALGSEPGNVFDLAEEHLALAGSTADIARGIRNMATEIAGNAGRAAFAMQEAAGEKHAAARARLSLAPVTVGLVTTLCVLATGLFRRRAPHGPDAPESWGEHWASDGRDGHGVGARVGAGHESEGEGEGGDPGAGAGHPLRVLLAEDEPFNQMIGASMLRRAGHSVEVVGDGRDAVAAVAAGHHDLVLLDLRMPDMDGGEAVRRIRSLPDARRANVRVIVLTASILPEDGERCLSAGADAVLAKPLRLDSLNAALRRRPPGNARHAPQEATRHGPTPVAALPAPPLLPDFDADAIATMREHLPDDRVASLIAGTATTLRDYHAALERSWTSGDQAAAGAMAHKIAGVAGLYGCLALQRAAQRLEAAVEGGNADPAPLKRALDDHLPAALAALKKQGAGLAEAGA
ncbi:hybrid sensor histidine kinase/response regulator [Azospirillum sp. SYSU D00513]|uniref:response regulator n=1 Tax=Azospirillum sp. SYSU D00513 TaxID=2812561 RepID=UPI001A974471|nr:hybrid sensor histidine kinase/response regulator [Azospirillum sp. SYSU D00513]